MAVAKATYALTDKSVSRNIEIAPGTTNSEERDLFKFMEQLGKRAPFETGWLPPGVRSYRQVGDTSQLVIVAEPSINNIRWGQSESQQNKPMYLLAQPWRVMVAQFINQEFRGARMFYSPVPVYSPDQQLYHQNVPNINCLGYQGNNVGWVCLYHQQPVADKPIGGKAMNVINRCSGQEPYNNNNMSGTHGPLIYQQHGKPNFTYNPGLWEKKTETEGIDWTLDPELWIPIKVASKDSQKKHDPNGVPLTIEMVMNGESRFYYNVDETNDLTRFHRGQMTVDDLVKKVITPAYVSTPAGPPKEVSEAKQGVPAADGDSKKPSGRSAAGLGGGWQAAAPPKYPCNHCGTQFPNNELTYLEGVNYKVCATCKPAYSVCGFCNKYSKLDDLNDNKDLNKKVCQSCQPKVLHCPGCDKDCLDNHTCDGQLLCFICSNSMMVIEISEVTQPKGGLKVIMHQACESEATACGNCGTIVRNIDTTTVNTIIAINGNPVVAPFMMCPACWTMCGVCNMPGVRNVIDNEGACAICVAQDKQPAQQDQPVNEDEIAIAPMPTDEEVKEVLEAVAPEIPINEAEPIKPFAGVNLINPFKEGK